ncbi:MAG: peptide MFS transporter [Bacteroidales bacterium]|jgi:POT family proton-dependent oligopeptide transporter|nr:peptide MFS transporter [Bacteroidales bacterium]
MRNHPKGLIAAALTNMGERFGFYIMMAILTLFISAQFGLSETKTGFIYSAFYASIYVLALVGGLIADKTRNYKGTILWGLIVMAIGYLVIAIPPIAATDIANSSSFIMYLVLICFGLLIIAFGNGLFKGNLQALVGQMYDKPDYKQSIIDKYGVDENGKPKKDFRDTGYQIFYMFINIGGFFAPWIAIAVRNWWLKHNGFDYNAQLPELCHQYINDATAMTAEQTANLTQYSSDAVLNGTPIADMGSFCTEYLDVFNRGFQYAFFATVAAILISVVIYLVNKYKFPDPAKIAPAKATDGQTASASEVKMAASEIRQRIYALFAVFGIVIFFWFSFHQNGYSLTYFARDYINLDIINLDLGFTSIKGAEIFQCVNPFFVVFLTPIIIWIFGALRKKGKEPSTPKKIGIGMGIAALGYVFMLLISTALPDKSALSGMSEGALSAMRLTPWVMVGMYFIMTVAELFISPLGLSFVSKVAPPHLQGVMQGCWLAATAVGNLLLFIGGLLYTAVPLWACWLVFVCACGLSMIVMLLMVKWLEKVAK